jgi:hypothetical protein
MKAAAPDGGLAALRHSCTSSGLSDVGRELRGHQWIWEFYKMSSVLQRMQTPRASGLLRPGEPRLQRVRRDAGAPKETARLQAPTPPGCAQMPAAAGPAGPEGPRRWRRRRPVRGDGARPEPAELDRSRAPRVRRAGQDARPQGRPGGWSKRNDPRLPAGSRRSRGGSVGERRGSGEQRSTTSPARGAESRCKPGWPARAGC